MFSGSSDIVFDINGINLEVVEVFSDNVIVQDVKTKEIYTLPVFFIEHVRNWCYNNTCEDESNVFSLTGWSKWRKKELKKLIRRKWRI